MLRVKSSRKQINLDNTNQQLNRKSILGNTRKFENCENDLACSWFVFSSIEPYRQNNIKCKYFLHLYHLLDKVRLLWPSLTLSIMGKIQPGLYFILSELLFCFLLSNGQKNIKKRVMESKKQYIWSLKNVPVVIILIVEHTYLVSCEEKNFFGLSGCSFYIFLKIFLTG